MEDQARGALQAGAWERAAASYRQALTLTTSRTTDVADPAMPRLQAGLSAALAGGGQFGPALRAAEACVRLDPRWHEGHACRARALSGLGQLRLSAEAFEAALRAAVADGGAGPAAKQAAQSALKYEQQAARVRAQLDADVALRKHAMDGRPAPARDEPPPEPRGATRWNGEAKRVATEGEKERSAAAARAREIVAAARVKRASTATGTRLKELAEEAANIRACVRPLSADAPTTDDGRRARLENLAEVTARRRQSARAAEPPFVPATADLWSGGAAVPAAKRLPPNARTERGTPYTQQVGRGPDWMWTQQPRALAS